MSKASTSKYSDCKLSVKSSKCSETEELTVILNKFNKGDIISNFIKKPSNEKPRSTKKTKQNIIEEAIKFLTEKFSDLDDLILFLQLKHIHTLKRTRSWTPLEIKEAKRFLRPGGLTTDKVSNSLQNYFRKYDIPCKIFTEKKGNCIWIVLYLGNEKPQRPIYLVAHTKLSAVFFNNLKQQYSSIVQKVIRKTFRGSDIEKFNSIQGNAEYIQNLNRKTFVNFEKNEGPKERHTAKKSRKENSDDSESEFDENFEDYPRKRKYPQRNIENSDLPKIERLQYYVKSSAFDRKERNGKCYSVCGINFKGKHVLKGLKHLVDSGVADGPLPDYLYKEPRSGKTEYVMTM